jgi:hypothetical protein
MDARQLIAFDAMKLAEEIERMVARERTSPVDTPVRKRVSNALAALPGVEGKGSWEFKWLEYEMGLSVSEKSFCSRSNSN